MNKDKLWVVEAANITMKKWNPVLKWNSIIQFGDGTFGIHRSRKNARLAARHMKTTNQYNKHIPTIDYRVTPYYS